MNKWFRVNYNQTRMIIFTVIILVWLIYINLFSHNRILIKQEAQILDNDRFYPSEVWGDGTIFRWNKETDVIELPPTYFRYAFVSFRGMTYTDKSRYLVQFSNAQPQQLTFPGIENGFRVNKFLFIANTAWNIDSTLVFSMTPIRFKPPIVNERALSVAITNISVNTIENNNLLIIETLAFFFLMTMIATTIDYLRYQKIGLALSIFVLSTQIWANIDSWGFSTRIIVWISIGLVTLHHSNYWRMFIRFLATESGISWPRYITHRMLLRSFLIIVLPFIWVWTSSFILYDRWQWNVNLVSPTPLILASIVAWPFLSFIIYKIIHIRKYHPITLFFFGIYASLGAILFTQIAPGCYPGDTLNSLNLTLIGRWQALYSHVQLPMITSFMQILPWGTHALFIFHLLFWVVTLTYTHTILFRQRSHWVFHVIIPSMLITPVFLMLVMNPMHHTTFASMFLFFLLLLYTIIKFRKINQYKYIGGISILGTIVGIYRTDSAPVVFIVFALIFLMIVKPEFFYRLSSSAQKSVLPLTWRRKTFLSICLLLPSIILYGYTQIIPPALLNSPFENSEKSWNNIREDFYQLTIIENTLSYILSQPTVKVRPEYRTKIAAVYDIDKLIQSYCPNNICYYWAQRWQWNSTTEMRNDAVRASIGIFLDNPVLFLESRIAHLNTVGSIKHYMLCRNLSARLEKNLTPLYESASITPLASDIIAYYISALDKNNDPWRSGIWVNVYFYLLLCLPIILTFRISPIESFVTLMLFLRTITVALTAQAGFFTYYAPVYVGVFLMYALWLPVICTYLSRHKHTLRSQS